jgi:hypothetical protein
MSYADLAEPGDDERDASDASLPPPPPTASTLPPPGPQGDLSGLDELVATLRAEAETHEARCRRRECAWCMRAVCVDCSATLAGVHPDAPVERRRCHPCAATHRAARAAERWARLVPPSHVEASLAAPWLRTLVGAHVLARVEASPLPDRVTLFGPPGAGKTALAVALLRRELPAHPDALFAAAHKLGKARAAHPLGEGEAPLVERALSCSLLVLDELGGETGHHSPTLGEIVYERHAQGRRTVVTTGLRGAEIVTRYGGGIARRLTEGALTLRLGKDGAA